MIFNYKIILWPLLCAPFLVGCSGDKNDESSSEDEYHTHYFGYKWDYNEYGHFHTCRCGEHSEVIPHEYEHWEYIVEPTINEPGSAQRRCQVCRYVEKKSLPKIEGHEITITNEDNSVTTFYTDYNGTYNLSTPLTTSGYFIGYYDDNDNLFPLSGKIEENTNIHIVINDSPYTASNVNELLKGTEAGISTILLTNSFTVDRTIYINNDITLTCDDDVVLKRSTNFGGDFFVVGQDKDGNESIIGNKPVTFNIAPSATKTITIDGNKDLIYLDSDNPTTTVDGSLLFITSLATVNLEEGVSLINAKKVSNNRTYEYSDVNKKKKMLSYPEKVGGAAIVNVSGTLNINGAILSNNEVNDSSLVEGDLSTQGGAIFSYGTTSFNDGIISNNKSTYGGGIYSYSLFFMKKGSFIGNTTYKYGGALYQPGSQYSDSRLVANTLSDILFKGNYSMASGGALFIGDQATCYAEKVSFEENSTDSSGGAINSKGVLDINYSRFYKNTCGSKGGAVYSYYGDETDEMVSRSASFDNCNFEYNVGPLGGALSYGSSLDDADYIDANHHPYGYVSNCTFDHNSAVFNSANNYGNGGAIYLQKRSDITVTNTTFTNNTAAKYGGAIYSNTHSKMNLTNVILNNNSADSDGGAMYFYTSTDSTLNNVSGDSNDSGRNGGFIYVSGKAILRMTNIISTRNNATNGGFMYGTTGDTVIYIYSGSTSECTSTNANAQNIYGNSTNTKFYIKGTTSKEFFDYDNTLITNKYKLEDIPE